jgi:aspartate beta-hydroxylase
MIDVTHLKGLLAAGRIEEAEAAAARSLDGHPDDVPTLKIAASCALGRAQPARAKSLLQHALTLVPGDADILYHLARSHEALGDAESALAADESALRAAPEHLPARLHYALGLERRDDAELALLHFMRVLKEAQSKGEWTDASTTPVALRPRVEHAVQAIRRGQQVVFQKLMAPLSARYGRASLERIHTAIRIYVGELKPNYPDARQRPTFFYIPGLPTSAYFDRRLFAWKSKANSNRCWPRRAVASACSAATSSSSKIFRAAMLRPPGTATTSIGTGSAVRIIATHVP